VKNYLVFFHLSSFGELPVNTNSLIRYFLRLDLLRNYDALFELVFPYLFILNLSQLTLCVRYCDDRVDGKGGVNFDIMFGPAYKGIPLGAVVCGALYSDYGIDVGFSYNRKEAKDHGEGGNLVGASMEGGKRVLVIDDVITAGTAIRESHAMLSAIGAKMVGVVIALDRAEKRSLDDPLSAVQAVKRDLEVSVISIVNLPQLQIFLEKSPDYGEEVLKTVSEYRSQYGV
jgi:orotate phosphoribosyltransferase